MDNLTHSLIGAALGKAGLERKTGLALPGLIIAANIPDIDAPCVVYGVESLAMRRGITHGPLALVVLPALVALALIAFDRWQTRRGLRPEARLPLHSGWLVGLCYLGALSHPLFDWFNNYGIRLLEPFSSQWFYGDTLFIIDPWILAILIVGMSWTSHQQRAGLESSARPTQIAFVVLAGYVGFNYLLSNAVAAQVAGAPPYPQVTVANAVPLAFWRREVLWRSDDGRYGAIPCSWFGCAAEGSAPRPTHMADPRVAAWSGDDPAARAFLFWSRMPVAEPTADGFLLQDQRFMDLPTSGNFEVTLTPRR